MRTVMMLLALADLTEQAATASHAVRAYVLQVLRPTELAAWHYAFGAEDNGFDELDFFELMAICIGGSRPRDALNLARSFREIAAALQQVMIQYRLLGGACGDDLTEAIGVGKFGPDATRQIAHSTLSGLRLAAVAIAFHRRSAAAGWRVARRLDTS